MIAGSKKVLLEDVSVRFRLSYDKTRTIQDKCAEFGRRLVFRKTPGYFYALKRVNLEVHVGDVLGVIGPNGSGKTTLLKTICGIFEPDEGSVQCEGQMSTLLSLGTGFDNTLSGIDNIRLNGLIMGMSPDEIEARIPLIAEFADIGEHLMMPMKYYSKGMISRVSFAIVLSMKPDILLIDEVFSVGDLEFQKKSTRAMRELLDQASCQVIVSHSLSLIREHCNRAIYMRGGSIVLDGSPDEVADRYEQEFRVGAACP